MYTTAEMQFQTEAEFVRWLRTLAPPRPSQVRMGIGDDAALVRVTPGRDLILTSDLSIEGVHFTTRLHPPGSRSSIEECLIFLSSTASKWWEATLQLCGARS